MTEVDSLLLEIGFEQAAEELLIQYFSDITEYILSISTSLQGESSEEFLKSLDEPTRHSIINQTSEIVDLCIHWELWELYDEAITILKILS